ncbi:hypothetical protein D1AOALGA4SA_10493 [Olavius algarvensis Delta 1 endosymbiont]|nr:hypothetical protein D1AOALGA4SA_10493 [Olavius algarvensis Delta 1 endosymbiont]
MHEYPGGDKPRRHKEKLNYKPADVHKVIQMLVGYVTLINSNKED